MEGLRLSNTFLCALAELDASAQERMRALYRMFAEAGLSGRQTAGIPYHLTLAYYGADQETQARGNLESACRNQASIPIRFSHVGLFGQKVLFLSPVMDEALMRLQKQVLLPGDGDSVWTAHATLLIDEPEGILRATAILTSRFEPFDAYVERVSLYEFFPPRRIAENVLRGGPGSNGDTMAP